MTSENNSSRSAIESARRTIAIERRAIEQLDQRIDDSFSKAVDLLASVEGRVVVSGMGKSGHIGNKIAATLASTGTPAQFVHPAEACHGDMGMITRLDSALLMSNSGTTGEITALLPLLKRLGIPIVAMTGNDSSTLARAADVHLNIGVTEEACPLDLAPTASTTANLVMGDALAIALLEKRLRDVQGERDGLVATHCANCGSRAEALAGGALGVFGGRSRGVALSPVKVTTSKTACAQSAHKLGAER